jgi:hypothetical protein
MSLSDFIKYKQKKEKNTSSKKVEDLFVISKPSKNVNIIDSDLNL